MNPKPMHAFERFFPVVAVVAKMALITAGTVWMLTRWLGVP